MVDWFNQTLTKVESSRLKGSKRAEKIKLNASLETPKAREKGNMLHKLYATMSPRNITAPK